MPERIKVIFRRVFVTNDADWFGSGEFYCGVQSDREDPDLVDPDLEAAKHGLPVTHRLDEDTTREMERVHGR